MPCTSSISYRIVRSLQQFDEFRYIERSKYVEYASTTTKHRYVMYLYSLIQCCLYIYISTKFHTYSLISSFSNFLTSSRLVRYFRLTAPAAVLGHLGTISLKNLTKRKEVRKEADQANCFFNIVSIQ